MPQFPKRRSRTGLFIGASSILVIFVLLCLVTFAVLSLVSARADKALSDKNTAHIQAYYAAETTAYEKLAKIDTLLAENLQAGTEDKAYFDQCESALHDAGYATRRDADALYVDYAVPISDTQQLTVKIRVHSAAERTAAEMAPLSSTQSFFYAIESWAIEGDNVWQPSDELPVYGTTAIPD